MTNTSSAVITSSGGSDESDADGVDLAGEPLLLYDLVLRSARPEALDADDETCDGACVVRAREDRRGSVLAIACSEDGKNIRPDSCVGKRSGVEPGRLTMLTCPLERRNVAIRARQVELFLSRRDGSKSLRPEQEGTRANELGRTRARNRGCQAWGCGLHSNPTESRMLCGRSSKCQSMAHRRKGRSRQPFEVRCVGVGVGASD